MTITQRLRELSGKATPGPWFYDSYAGVHSQRDLGTVASCWAGPRTQTSGGTATNKADPELIAEMRNTLDALLDVVEAARVHHCYSTPETTSEEGTAFCPLCEALARLDEEECS